MYTAFRSTYSSGIPLVSVIEGVIPKSLQLLTQVTEANVTRRKGVRSRVRVYQVFQKSMWWWWWCQYSSAYIAAEIVWRTEKGRKFCDTPAEGGHAKWRRLCGSKPVAVKARNLVSCKRCYTYLVTYCTAQTSVPHTGSYEQYCV